jgi:hypothetical protein
MIFLLGGSKPTPTETRQSRGAEGQIIGLTSDSPKGLCIGFPLIPAMKIRTYDHRPPATGVCPICTTKAGFRSIRTTLFFHACYANPSLRGFLAYKPCLFVGRPYHAYFGSRRRNSDGTRFRRLPFGSFDLFRWIIARRRWRRRQERKSFGSEEGQGDG